MGEVMQWPMVATSLGYPELAGYARELRLANTGEAVVVATTPAARQALRQRPRVLMRAASVVGGRGVRVVIEGEGEAETPSPAPPASGGSEQIIVHLVEFDPTKRGWVQVSNYAVRFWLPLLGAGAFATWLALRSYAYEAGRGEGWPSMRDLAAVCARGNKQTLIGRNVQGRHRRGYLEILRDERLIWYRIGGGRYWFRVVQHLPLLTPSQVARLSPRLQGLHAEFIKRARLDYDEWLQLRLPTLADAERERREDGDG